MLCDCRHFAPSEPGFSPSTDLQLLEVVNQQQPESLSKYVTIVLNQIYIEEGLVYDKWSGALIGYADLGEATNLLDEAEDQAIQDKNHLRPLAKCMLVFMIKGLLTSLEFPYVQFPAVSTKGSSLLPLLWRIVAHLTRLGLVVLVWCAMGLVITGRCLAYTAVVIRQYTRLLMSTVRRTIRYFLF